MSRADATLVFDADTKPAQKALGDLQNSLKALAVGFVTKELIALADAGTVLQNKLKSVSGSTQEAIKAFDNVSKIAMKTGTDISAVGDLYQKIALQSKALGLSQEEVARITENFSKALVTTGTVGAAASSAIYQFAQSLGRGKVAYEDIKQLQEASSATVTLIAGRFKMSGQEFLEAVQKGKVSSQQLALAVNSLGKDVDGTFNGMNKTIGQSMENMKTSMIVLITKFEESTGTFAGLAKILEFLAKHMDVVVIAAGTFMAVFAAKKIIDIAVAFKTLNAVMKANPLFLIASIGAAAVATIMTMLEKEEEIAVATGEVAKQEEKVRDVKDAVVNLGAQQLKDLTDYLNAAEGEARIAGLFGEELDIRKAIVNASKQLKIPESELSQEVKNRVVSIERIRMNNEAMVTTQQKLVQLADQISVYSKQDVKEQEVAAGMLDYRHSVTAKIYEQNKASYEFMLRQTLAIRELAQAEAELLVMAQRRNAPMKFELDMLAKLQEANRSAVAVKEAEMNITDRMAEVTLTSTNSEIYIMDELNKTHQRLLVTKQLIEQSTMSEANKAINLANIENKLKYDYEVLDIKLHDARMAREDEYWSFKEKRRIDELQKQGWSLDQSKSMAADSTAFAKKSESEKATWAMEQGSKIFNALAATNKKAFMAAKAYNIAEAIMNTYTGVTKALATYPPPFNFIAAGATLAMGLAQVATIRSQQYSGRAIGGSVISDKSYVVGENGPEMFTPQGAGSITPNNKLGGDVTNINFTINAVDTRNFQQLLAEQKGLIVGMVRSAVNDKGRQFAG